MKNMFLKGICALLVLSAASCDDGITDTPQEQPALQLAHISFDFLPARMSVQDLYYDGNGDLMSSKDTILSGNSMYHQITFGKHELLMMTPQQETKGDTFSLRWTKNDTTWTNHEHRFTYEEKAYTISLVLDKNHRLVRELQYASKSMDKGSDGTSIESSITTVAFSLFNIPFTQLDKSTIALNFKNPEFASKAQSFTWIKYDATEHWGNQNVVLPYKLRKSEFVEFESGKNENPVSIKLEFNTPIF